MMLRRGLFTAMVLALTVVPLSAELKYTMRMQLDVPAETDAAALAARLQAIGKQLQVEVSLTAT